MYECVRLFICLSWFVYPTSNHGFVPLVDSKIYKYFPIKSVNGDEPFYSIVIPRVFHTNLFLICVMNLTIVSPSPSRINCFVQLLSQCSMQLLFIHWIIYLLYCRHQRMIKYINHTHKIPSKLLLKINRL